MPADQIRDVQLVVDAIDDFGHADGAALLASFRERETNMQRALRTGRSIGVDVVYANDNRGVWDGNPDRLLREAVEHGAGGDIVVRGHRCPTPPHRF